MICIKAIMQSFSQYLVTFKANSGDLITHTSISGGSYSIPKTANATFYNYYKRAFSSMGEIPLHLTEKHLSISPILIDLDFRQRSSTRIYDNDLIHLFLDEYIDILKQYVHCKEPIVFYVLQKGVEPRQYKDGLYKDGIHIICPSVITKPEIQALIRNAFIESNTNLFANYGFVNPIDDIIDERVIKTNNWLMYGSNKPGEDDRYLVTHKVTITNEQMIIDEEDNPWNPEYVEIFSIRNKINESKYTQHATTQLKKLRQSKRMDDEVCKMTSVSNKHSSAPTFDLEILKDTELAIALVGILDKSRSHDYTSWINLGLCLYNIDPTSDDLLDKWIEFSQTSPKFKEGECEIKWNSFTKHPEGLSMGTLRMWARQDNPEEYQKILQNNILYFVNESSSGAHADIAKVVYNMYGHIFKCVSLKTNAWYEFKDHRWHYVENGYTLRKLISTDVFKMYITISGYFNRKALETQNAIESVKFVERAIIFGDIAKKLKMCSFKDNIMRECMEFCFDPKFLDRLDSQPHLIGFENGVYDLDKSQFRDGLPDDYISFTTGYSYTPNVIPHIRDYIKSFVESICVNKENAEYLLKVLAYSLHGNKYLEYFWFFTGCGRNGKGTIAMLLEKTLGNYYYEPDITMVTSTKKCSSAANPELAKAKGKRILCSSEPDDEDKNAKFRVNKLKQLRGNDLIQARGLFKDFIEFRPQFAMIFQMNDKPDLSKADSAIANTLKIIEFPYQFVANPIQDHQKKADTTIKDKFKDDVNYHQQMILLLMEYYRQYVLGKQVFEEPKEVTSATNEYMEDNNQVAVWLKENYEITLNPKDRITVDDLYSDYNMPNISKKKFGGLMSLAGFKSQSSGNVRFYAGIKEKVKIDHIK